MAIPATLKGSEVLSDRLMYYAHCISSKNAASLLGNEVFSQECMYHLSVASTKWLDEPVSNRKKAKLQFKGYAFAQHPLSWS
jgi:hypothetical protein